MGGGLDVTDWGVAGCSGATLSRARVAARGGRLPAVKAAAPIRLLHHLSTAPPHTTRLSFSPPCSVSAPPSFDDGRTQARTHWLLVRHCQSEAAVAWGATLAQFSLPYYYYYLRRPAPDLGYTSKQPSNLGSRLFVSKDGPFPLIPARELAGCIFARLPTGGLGRTGQQRSLSPPLLISRLRRPAAQVRRANGLVHFWACP